MQERLSLAPQRSVFLASGPVLGLRMWYWAREDIPHDLAADSPDVSTWGEPYVFFPFGPLTWLGL